MKRAHKLILLAAAISPVIVIAASCGFPDPSFRPDSDGSTGDGPGDGAAGDSAADGSRPPVGANEDVDPDGGAVEASTRPEGGGIDAAGCTTCDCDGDKFQKAGGACDGGPGPRPDCDDTDDFIRPDQGFVAEKVWPSAVHKKEFDWNCDGERTKQHRYNVKCDDPNNCPTGGFRDDPLCGETDTFNLCKYTPGLFGVLATCTVDGTVQVTQGCK